MRYLFSFILSWAVIQNSYSQQTYATQQAVSFTGNCVGCSVSDPDNPVNNNDLTDYSSFKITAGLAGVYISQTLIFPTPNTNIGCDSLVIGIASNNSVLSANLFGGITVQTYNGATANNDSVSGSSLPFNLLSTNTQGQIILHPTAKFDRVKITLSSTMVGLLDELRIFYAYRSQSVIPAPTVSISDITVCQGTVVTLNAGKDNDTIDWYDDANAGNLLFTGSKYAVSPLKTTSYYAGIRTNGCSGSKRARVTVNVNPLPTSSSISGPSYVCKSSPAKFSIDTIQSGVSYYWFDAATDGNLVYTGNTFTVDTLTKSSTFYVRFELDSSHCRLPHREVVAVMVKQISSPTLTNPNLAICIGDTASFYVTTPDTNVDIKWYDALTGGNTIFTGPVFKVSPAANTAYYVNAGSGTCDAPGPRVKAFVNVNPRPIMPTIAPLDSVCEGTSATIKITNQQNGITYNLFNKATGDTSIASSNTNTITTPVLKSDTTLYLDANQPGGNCNLVSRIAVKINVKKAPAPPTVSTPPTICSGDSTKLSATPGKNGSSVEWYSNGNTLLSQVSPFTVKPLITTTYYALTKSSGCSSASRTPITVTVNQSVAPVKIDGSADGSPTCVGTSQTLSVHSPQSGVVYSWFAVPVGGTPLVNNNYSYTTDTLNSDQTFYLDATITATGCHFSGNTRTPILVTVSKLIPPVAYGTTICNGDSTILTASTANTGEDVEWYSAAKNGMLLQTGKQFKVKPITTTTYYASTKTTSCSSSTRTPVTVTVKQLVTPVITSSPVSICSGSGTNLAATTTEPGGTIEWYTSPTGGTSLGSTSPIYVTPTFTTTYYAATKASGCISAAKASVLITVNKSASIQSIDPIDICTGQTASLTVKTPEAGVTYSWFTSKTGGTAVSLNNLFTTAVLSKDTTFYLEATTSINNCHFSDGMRIPITVTVNNVSISGNDVNLCKGNTAFLTASSNQASANFQWYADASTTTALSNTKNYQVMPNITTTYYVEASSGNCTSKRIPVKVSVFIICPIAARKDSLSTLYKTSITIPVTANDSTASGTTFILTSIDLIPSKSGIQHDTVITNQGEFIADNSGNVTFTPADNFTGLAKIQYTVQNSQNVTSSPAWIIVTVGPNAKPDQQTGIKNTPVKFGDITSNDIDVDGINKSSIDLDPLQPGIQTVKTSSGGTFTLTNDSVTFVPYKDFVGSTGIKYVVNDNKGISSLQTDILVTVSEPHKGIFIPQGFSPNGDGLHDYFVIEGIEEYNASLTIFDRTGNIIYGDKHYKNNWDGSLNAAQDVNTLADTKINAWGNEKASEGTYFYILELTGITAQNYNGYMIISR